MEELIRHATLAGAAISVLKDSIDFTYYYPNNRKAVVAADDNDQFVVELFFSEHSSKRYGELSYEAAVFLLGYFHKYKG